jgi:hypothetical protein
MKSNSDLMREYIDKLDEIVRGYFTQQGDPDYGVRPRDQQDRDALAKGLKQARAYNRAEKDWYASTDTPDPNELDLLKQRNQGSISGSIITSRDGTGRETEVGAPLSTPNYNADNSGGAWAARAVNTKKSNYYSGFKDNSWAGTSARDGKATQVKRPSKPGWASE